MEKFHPRTSWRVNPAMMKCLSETFSVSSSLQDKRSRWVWEVEGSRTAQINWSATSSTLQTTSTVGQKFGSFHRFSLYSSIKQPWRSTKAGFYNQHWRLLLGSEVAKVIISAAMEEIRWHRLSIRSWSRRSWSEIVTSFNHTHNLIKGVSGI